MNALVKVDYEAAEQYLDGVVADLSPGFSGPIAKFNKGDYFINGILVRPDEEFVFDLYSFTRCWVRFSLGSPPERIVETVGTKRLPRREDLGDTDQSLWKLDDKTLQPRDPWALFHYIGMRRLSDDVLIMFETSSWGGKEELGSLIKCRQRHPGMSPKIKLGTRSTPHPKYGRVVKPHFIITGWVPRDGADDAVDDAKMIEAQAHDLEPQTPEHEPVEHKANTSLHPGADFDDEIPF